MLCLKYPRASQVNSTGATMTFFQCWRYARCYGMRWGRAGMPTSASWDLCKGTGHLVFVGHIAGRQQCQCCIYPRVLITVILQQLLRLQSAYLMTIQETVNSFFLLVSVTSRIKILYTSFQCFSWNRVCLTDIVQTCFFLWKIALSKSWWKEQVFATRWQQIKPRARRLCLPSC